MPGWLPFLIGAVLVVQFAGLGSWQVSRGLEKRAQQQMFSDETIYTDWSDGLTIRPYQRI